MSLFVAQGVRFGMGRRVFLRDLGGRFQIVNVGVAMLAAGSTAFPQDDHVRRALDALVAAFPEALVRHDDTALFWRDGTAMPVADNILDKTFDQLLRHASIIDQFRIPYPQGALAKPPAVNADPGRFRNTAFFEKMYGDCRKGEVEASSV
jgi:hypothetical protein